MKKQRLQRDASPARLPSGEAVEMSEPAQSHAFALGDVPRPSEHWVMHTFPNYDGIAYVRASLIRITQAVIV
ncbi:hypothetical protein HPB52_011200 [Rhipicephalus sanguineus]|uniref:Uncharacterized protein n=1 Tax=Rhipicephalus sanguineus TaxID=34632 RepID=A0A9D4PRQ9_RHISA|nr:hypothetical protein HPB52_011200 [Rhipicephalus sanguineus]